MQRVFHHDDCFSGISWWAISIISLKKLKERSRAKLSFFYMNMENWKSNLPLVILILSRILPLSDISTYTFGFVLLDFFLFPFSFAATFHHSLLALSLLCINKLIDEPTCICVYSCDKCLSQDPRKSFQFPTIFPNPYLNNFSFLIFLA